MVKRILKQSNDKMVIVSQWTSVLGIIADHLTRQRIEFVELTGKTPIKSRNDIVCSFNKPNTSERVRLAVCFMSIHNETQNSIFTVIGAF